MHFSPETALNLIERTTSEAERRFWDKHIESCSECVVELCEWSTLVGWVTRIHLVSAPEDVLALAKRIVKAPPKTPQVPGFVRQIAASLVFDSFAQPLGIGAREEVSIAPQATSRELVLQAEEFDIYLKITAFKEHRELLGQILPRGSNTFVNDATLHLRRFYGTEVSVLEFCSSTIQHPGHRTKYLHYSTSRAGDDAGCPEDRNGKKRVSR